MNEPNNEIGLPNEMRERIEAQGMEVPAGVDLFQLARKINKGEVDPGNACIRFDDESLGRHSYEITVQASRKAPGPGVRPDYRFPPGSAAEYINQTNKQFGGVLPGSPSEKVISEKTKKVCRKH